MSGVVVLDPILVQSSTGNILNITEGSAHVVVTSSGIMQTETPPATDIIVTGTITTSGGSVQVAIAGYNSIGIVISGTWVATLTCEFSSDAGTSWISMPVRSSVYNVNQGIVLPVVSGTITTNGTYAPNVTGSITHIRIRASAFTSGTVDVLIMKSESVPTFTVGQVAITQNAIVLYSNSTSVNLPAFGMYTGTAELTLGANSIQVNFVCSNDCSVYIQQSDDSLLWDIQDSYYVPNGFSDARTIQVTGMYVRVIVTNARNNETTFLRLSTVLRPMAEPLPRALTQKGYLKVAIQEMHPTEIEGSSERVQVTDTSVRRLLNDMLKQLMKMNTYLEVMTDEHLNEHDYDVDKI